MISNKYPPLTYLVTAIFQQVLGTGNDTALAINFLYSAILILSVYSIGKTLFNREIGLWAAGLSVLLPRLYQVRLEYLLDTPLMALTVACFCCLTIWRSQESRRKQWLWAAIFGVVWGLALLTKQSVLFFLIIPLLWLGISYLWRRNWERLGQLIASFFLSAFLWFPWYRTNWIYLFSTAQNSNATPASLEGDPPLNTLAAWTYYWQDLPQAVSWVLLIVPLVGLLLQGLGRFANNKNDLDRKLVIRGMGWLFLYIGSAYLICSAIYNKDLRYPMPYLPIVAVFLAYCLTLWRGKWRFVRPLTVGIAILIMVGKLFPVPGLAGIAPLLSPGNPSYPYRGAQFLNSEVIETVIETTPYQRATLGVIPSVGTINHNNLNYFGALHNFQVYGRELGVRQEQVEQDGRSLDWLVTKTGDNGAASVAQLALAKGLEGNGDFRMVKSWLFPDNTTLKLYHRSNPKVTVEPIAPNKDKVELEQVIVPEKVPPGSPIPVTYQWVGNWQQLASGLVLLTWQLQQSGKGDSIWLQDHAIGMGTLYEGNLAPAQQKQSVRVKEVTAMLPGGKLLAGDYTLSATYLNRQTGETYPLKVPPLRLTIEPQATIVAAPELDYVTQLRQLSLSLPEGRKGLDRIFQQVARLNQYDPIQDYLQQAERTLIYRLNNSSPTPKQRLNWTYNLALAQVLQEDVQGAIATFKSLSRLDRKNPYAHAYLAFVYLYNWQAKAAEKALQPALALQPNLPEIQALNAISALMQGNFSKAWRIFHEL
jgi:4-amino-4-deoxy-L-arabinose transferase-like glycosyltransferase